jgi:nucleolar MIF4G domain-containing protein 1
MVSFITHGRKSVVTFVTVKSHEPLRFTLADIRSSEIKGKWWLVGAAWTGDPLVELNDRALEPTPENVENERLLKLARKQGMNTDIRRSIFVVLMTSEVILSVVPAFSRLMFHLGLFRRI